MMDYIIGQPVDSCWDGHSNEQKMDVSKQPAKMILAMQSVKLPEPGSGFRPYPSGCQPLESQIRLRVTDMACGLGERRSISISI